MQAHRTRQGAKADRTSLPTAALPRGKARQRVLRRPHVGVEVKAATPFGVPMRPHWHIIRLYVTDHTYIVPSKSELGAYFGIATRLLGEGGSNGIFVIRHVNHQPREM